MSVILQQKTICKKKHIFREIESDKNGKPIKYKCIACNLIYEVKKDINPKDYFDVRNSIFNKMKENTQKINFINLNSIGLAERIHIDHLTRENAKMVRILNQG